MKTITVKLYSSDEECENAGIHVPDYTLDVPVGPLDAQMRDIFLDYDDRREIYILYQVDSNGDDMTAHYVLAETC